MIINSYRYATGGGGGIPVVEDFVATTSTTTTSITAIAPSGITANELLILLMTSDTATDPYGTTPSGWTKLFSSGSSGSAAIGIFYKIAAGSETDVTVTVGSADHIVWYLRVSGVDTSTPINVLGTANAAAGNNLNALSIDTTVDNCLAFFLYSFDGGDGYPFSVSGTGWSLTDEQQVSTSGSVNSGCWGNKDQETSGATGNVLIGASTTDGQTAVQFAIAPA